MFVFSFDLPVSNAILSDRKRRDAFFRLEFDSSNRLVSIFDKQRQRQVVPAGAIANEWQLFEDKPGTYNAWDILPNYVDYPIPLSGWESIEVAETGPLSVALKLTTPPSAMLMNWSSAAIRSPRTTQL